MSGDIWVRFNSQQRVDGGVNHLGGARSGAGRRFSDPGEGATLVFGEQHRLSTGKGRMVTQRRWQGSRFDGGWSAVVKFNQNLITQVRKTD